MVVIETAGIPAVGIFGRGFHRLAEMLAEQYGVPERRLGLYPGVMATDSHEAIAEQVATALYPQVLRGLLGPDMAATPEAAPTDRARSGPPPIIMEGDLDEIQESFHQRGWTDGLPIIPPTAERVDRLLAHTPASPDRVLGILAPEQREATVWSVAINGVMAGCRPEYMPLLVAIVECLADPVFRIEDAGSTPGWEPLVIVSGPLVAELGFNTGTGAMRVGRQANTSIGRFVRLYMRNIAGFRIPPGTTDQAGFGMSFLVAMAEDDAAITELGWPPHRVDRGFALGDTVVTVQSAVSIGSPIYSSGDDPGDHLRILAHYVERSIPPFVAGSSIKRQGGHHVLALSPAIARVLAGHGLSKGDVQHYLYDEVRGGAGFIEYIARNGPGVLDLTEMVAKGELPEEYATSSDPDRRVRILVSPESVAIVVAGNPGRNQSRAYIGNHVQGPPVTRQVVTVADPS